MSAGWAADLQYTAGATDGQRAQGIDSIVARPAALVRENVLGRVFERLMKATYFGQSVPMMTSTSLLNR